MAYSKITSVEVTNFMVYSRAKLVFDETNIVNIKGYNSAGKSSMLKAIGVCLFNMFPKSQTKLIRHGEDYFRVVVNFDDGVSILRDKYANGQSLYEMYKNGTCIFTTKEGRKLSKVDDVPDIIKTYLALCDTSYGYLNYQSRQDKLWLVETTGSENYASLNEILKSEEIARASALINSDRNKLNSEITAIEGNLQSVRMELLSAEAYTEELLHALEERDRLVSDLNRRLNLAGRLVSTTEEVMGITPPPDVSFVDTTRLEKVSALVSLLTDALSIKVTPSIDKVDSRRFESICSISEAVNGLAKGTRKTLQVDIPEVSMGRLGAIINIVQLADTYAKELSNFKSLRKETVKMGNTLDAAVKEAEASGVHFVKCDSCGSYTEVKEEVVS